MMPEPGQTYSLGEDRVLVLEVHATKLSLDKQPIEGEVRLVYLNEIKTLDIKSFQSIATRI
jgi:hypothetical protein